MFLKQNERFWNYDKVIVEAIRKASETAKTERANKKQKEIDEEENMYTEDLYDSDDDETMALD